MKTFLKCSPYLIQGTAIDAESKTIFALKNCQLLTGLLRGVAVTPLPGEEAWAVLRQLSCLASAPLLDFKEKYVCVCRRKRGGC